MNRRDFLARLLAGASGAVVAATVDVDKLLWVPGKRFFLPSPKPALAFHPDAFKFVCKDLFNPKADLARQYRDSIMLSPYNHSVAIRWTDDAFEMPSLPAESIKAVVKAWADRIDRELMEQVYADLNAMPSQADILYGFGTLKPRDVSRPDLFID